MRKKRILQVLLVLSVAALVAVPVSAYYGQTGGGSDNVLHSTPTLVNGYWKIELTVNNGGNGGNIIGMSLAVYDEGSKYKPAYVVVSVTTPVTWYSLFSGSTNSPVYYVAWWAGQSGSIAPKTSLSGFSISLSHQDVEVYWYTFVPDGSSFTTSGRGEFSV